MTSLPFRAMLIPFILLFSLHIIADDLVITGYAGGNLDSEILLYRYSDPVSRNEVFVAATRPDSTGRFLLSIGNSGITHYFIRNGIHDNHFFAGDSSLIDIVCYPFEPLPDRAVTDPFFSFEKINAADTRACSLNNLIISFEEQYEEGLMHRYGKIISSNKQLEDLRITASSGCKGMVEHSYAALWARFREASLKVAHIPDPKFRRETFREYALFFDPGNEAATQLAGFIYTGYIRELIDTDGGDIVNRVMEAGETPANLIRLVTDKTGLNSITAQYILLDNLYREFFESRFNHANVVAVTGWFRDNGEGERIREIASSLYNQMRVLLPGGELAHFSLEGDDGQSYSPDSFMEKYLLMVFLDTRSPLVWDELTLLKNNIVPYSKYIEIVTILCDPDYELAQAVLKAKGFDWLMLNASGEYGFQSVYKTRPLPLFVFAGPGSVVINNPAPWPSENLMKIISSILQPYFLNDINNRAPAFR